MNVDSHMVTTNNQLSIHTLDFIFKSGAMGIFQKSTKENVFKRFMKIDLSQLTDLNSRDEYDQIYDQTVLDLHQSIFPLYKENLKNNIENPYSYTARLLNQFIKLNFMNSSNISSLRRNTIHPIISNSFIELYLPDIKSISAIEGYDTYYDIIGYYRYLIDTDLNAENEQLSCMLQGIEV